MTTIALMMSNYFHDFATALLISNIVLFHGIVRALSGPLALSQQQAEKVVSIMTRVSVVALVWIIVGGTIRSLNYDTFEWVEAAGKGQVVALGVKHAVMGGGTMYALVLQFVLVRRFRKTGTFYPSGKQ